MHVVNIYCMLSPSYLSQLYSNQTHTLASYMVLKIHRFMYMAKYSKGKAFVVFVVFWQMFLVFFSNVLLLSAADIQLT